MPLRPTRALIALLILWTLLGLAGSMWLPAVPWWGWMGSILAAVSLFDALVVFALRAPKAERGLPGRMAVGIESEVALRIINPT